MAYGPDFCPGAMTADSMYGSLLPTYYGAHSAFDDDEATRWSSTQSSLPHWVKYDQGAGLERVARKFRMKPFKHDAESEQQLKAFKLQGSNNDSDWDDLVSDEAENTGEWQEWEFENLTAYRYYRVYVTTTWEQYPNTVSIWEIELFEVIGGGGNSKFNRSLN